MVKQQLQVESMRDSLLVSLDEHFEDIERLADLPATGHDAMLIKRALCFVTGLLYVRRAIAKSMQG